MCKQFWDIKVVLFCMIDIENIEHVGVDFNGHPNY